jgi:hypothetical protein
LITACSAAITAGPVPGVYVPPNSANKAAFSCSLILAKDWVNTALRAEISIAPQLWAVLKSALR